MRECGSYPPRPTVQRQACPQCNRCGLTERKKLKPKWRCIGCHNEFDESIMVEIPINNRTEKDEYDKYRQEVLFPAFDDFVDAHQDIVEQRYTAALAEYDKERQVSDDEYLSGEGTATAPFPGPSGTYRVDVGAVAEWDGQPTLELWIGGVLKKSWTYPLASPPYPPYHEAITLQGPTLYVANDLEIKLVGRRNAGAHARVDHIIFTPEV